MSTVAEKPPVSDTATDTLKAKTKDGSVISGGHLVAKALKAEGRRYHIHALRRAYYRYLRWLPG